MWITPKIRFTYAEYGPRHLWKKLWITPGFLWTNCG